MRCAARGLLCPLLSRSLPGEPMVRGTAGTPFDRTKKRNRPEEKRKIQGREERKLAKKRRSQRNDKKRPLCLLRAAHCPFRFDRSLCRSPPFRFADPAHSRSLRPTFCSSFSFLSPFLIPFWLPYFLAGKLSRWLAPRMFPSPSRSLAFLRPLLAHHRFFLPSEH